MHVLRRKSYLFLFLFSGLAYGILYAVLTNLIDIRLGLNSVIISFTKTSATFFAVFSILGGLLIALQVFAIRNRQKSIKSANIGFIGAFLSFFTTTCPFCKPLLLSLLGFSSSLALLKYGIALAILSVLLLLTSIYLVTTHLEKVIIKNAKK